MSIAGTKVAVLSHANDAWGSAAYMMPLLLDAWRQEGVLTEELHGIDKYIPADVLILHIDLTVDPQDYLVFCKRYPVVINGRIADISKHRVSTGIITSPDSYDGQVIVKTNLNFGGIPERRTSKATKLGRMAGKVRRRLPWTWTGILSPYSYPIYSTPRLIPRIVWHNRNLIVEKFLPEREGEYYCLRQWIFLGDKEINVRGLSTHPIIKASNIIHREIIESVPDRLRTLRKELGFDYGKFDYAMVDGDVFLYDVNKTFSISPQSTLRNIVVEELKQGLTSFLS